ncbi:MAG: glutaredoxin 3 [Gammaproteobacteria bacterium]|nr:glutaredoxin 3 [Gammaproteobacteria bacterium]MEE2693478.1 glutaredoxin 3 [Pseudomonadota bacterium]|tara:strand:+ start:78 stop:326 length:249 start_codon:yes stop_codon:yes gene_type:complete
MIVKIYSTAICPYCERAKMLLEKRNIKYTEFKIDEDVKLFEEMLALSNGRRSVPQIFIDDQHIGGYDDLVDFDLDGGLKSDE